MNSTKQPQNRAGSRLCLHVSKEGLKVYGNANALKSLADWLTWTAAHPPAEHFECHVGLDLLDDESKFEDKKPPNVFVKIDTALSGVFMEASPATFDGQEVMARGFELTFMNVSESELDAMAEQPGA